MKVHRILVSWKANVLQHVVEEAFATLIVEK